MDKYLLVVALFLTCVDCSQYEVSLVKPYRRIPTKYELQAEDEYNSAAGEYEASTNNKNLYLDNDHGNLGMLVPLSPFASVTGNTGLLSSGMTGAALLNFKAAAVLAFYLALRRGNKKRYFKVNKLFSPAGVDNGGHGDGHHHHHHHVEEHGHDDHHAHHHHDDGHHNHIKRTKRSDHRVEFSTTIEHCAEKLICQLYNSKEILKEDELLILQLFGGDYKAAMKKSDCNYSNCSHDSNELMSRLRAVEV